MSRAIGFGPRGEQLAATPLRVARVEPSFLREIATSDDAERPRSLNLSAFGEDEHPSEVLRKHSSWKHRVGELYDEMPRLDGDLGAFMLKRRDAVAALPRAIVPANGSPRAIEIAAFVRDVLSRIRRLQVNVEHQLGAIPRGLAIEELVYERISRGPLSGAWCPVAMIDRPMHRFAFRSGVLHVRRPSGQPLLLAPPGKFLVATHGTKDHPWGDPLLDACYPSYFLKRNGWKFWATYLDKWAMPTGVGKYQHRADRGTNGDAEKLNRADQATLLEAIRNIQADYGVVIPEGLTIELLEAQRSGSASYESFIVACTKPQALLMLGEIDTSGASKATGSYAKSEVSDQVRKEKVKLDAHELATHWTDNLIRPLVEINWGAGEPIPRFEIAAEEAEDRQDRREGIKFLLANGLPVARRSVYQAAGQTEPREGEEVLAAPASPAEPAKGTAKMESAAPVVPLARDESAAVLAEIDDRIARVDAELERVVAQLAPLAAASAGRWLEILAELWDEGAIAEGEPLSELVRRLSPRRDAERLEVAGIHGAGIRLAALLEVTEPSGLRLASPDYTKAQTPSSAIDYWSKQLNLPKEAFNLLTDANRRMAFTMAGVDDASLLLDLQALLARLMSEGLTREKFLAEAKDLWKRRGLDPASPWHLGLVYANATRTAAGLMLYQQTVGNPLARRLTPYLIVRTFGDNRVRERPEHNHAVVDQVIFAVDHEFWQTWWIPFGHECRCSIEAINAGQAKRLGLTGSEPRGPWPEVAGSRALPDPGFQSAPNIWSAVNQATERSAVAQRRAEEIGGDIADAMRDLLEQLLGGPR